MNWMLLLAGLCGAAFCAEPPRFEDYPVTEIYRGKVAKPVILGAEQRRYATQIRDGVENGWGVEHSDGNLRVAPNFAGHDLAIEWGCGTGCLRMAFVDARNGRVYYPPLSHGPRDPMALPMFGQGYAKPEFRLGSRLLKIDACDREQWTRCATYYFCASLPAGAC